ncbi:metallophosphoesterase family protein [Mucilaginibacter sp. KACC 22063]|uniref:metallophosphoesterase family protein n=1 Tax=Mucilaginibacter sp. KACC 22063 TaxID=3025666 RepID=UPI00236703BE|nr:metallophosphoesterase [Mucilaginibacter sp. KACC 22063]WDF56071.1 metallophosphoesterase [Mucilaginibacter sp. KACC 22063]
MQRRSALKNIGGLLIAPSLSFNLSNSKRKALRIAHITDVHLKNQFDAPARFTKCLKHLQQQTPKVDFILNGGDIVFDMNKENIDTINGQWKLYKNVFQSECSLPVHYCLGNHDIWWNEDDKGQAIYGKKYSMDQLGLTKPYYSFEKAGWKFIILDSVHLDIDNTWYIGKLGDEQFSWLEQELKNTDPAKPVLVLSHIPILTATNLIEDNIVNKWVMLGGDMHTDTAKIINLFYHHPNVKLCLSGHIHLREKLVYNNVTYICNGAVSGAWWEGNRRETKPGYGVIDLYDDGSFEEAYINY